MNYKAWLGIQPARTTRLFSRVYLLASFLPSSPRPTHCFTGPKYLVRKHNLVSGNHFCRLSTTSTDAHNINFPSSKDSELIDEGNAASQVDEEDLFETTLYDDEDLSSLPPGSNDGFYVVKQYKTSLNSFNLDNLSSILNGTDLRRLELTPKNVSLPIALMMLDPEAYPSQSRARKACRKGNILIHRGPLDRDEVTGDETVFMYDRVKVGRVGDRINPGDVVAKQVRMGDGYYRFQIHQKPPFELPIVYEDDHFAIVNKPAGVVVYAHRKSGDGIMAVRAALPFVITPPKVGTYSTLRRPQPVHRLDKPTSGLLLVAKTKPAMVDLSIQFRDRKVKKTYVAIVNGIPDEPEATRISSRDAYELGVEVDPDSKDTWQIIDCPLDEKSAVTVWRPLRYAKSLKARDNYLTLVDLKPKTGRYHQLRRHMGWICDRPIVGDKTYDGGGPAMQLRERGLFLCSNSVTLEHPFYNSEKGRKIFDEFGDEDFGSIAGKLWLSKDDKVMVTCSIGIPEKFGNFMDREEERYNKLADT